MAAGIVEVFAKAGYDVVFVARGEEKVARMPASNNAANAFRFRVSKTTRQVSPINSFRTLAHAQSMLFSPNYTCLSFRPITACRLYMP